MQRKILVVEDDVATGTYLLTGLQKAGYDVEWAQDGSGGIELARRQDFDGIVLDRMLPGMDGLLLLQTIRAEGVNTPVIILSAIGKTDERVRGLRAGSDDYLIKPFEIDELIARLEVLQRRQGRSATVVTRLTCEDLTLDLLASRAERAGQVLLLQPRARQLLEFLMRNQGRIVTRSMIYEKVWNLDFDPGTNVIDVYVSSLRKEIDRPGLAPLLQTVRKSGYVLGLPGNVDPQM
ncbi:response regulator transcription factor [Sphingomonas prati]|uniref:Two-component system OmpR family response regulator n=1 Tax=Sphingomonas prati TaxID=1843237 RepID=A0A7W9F048_9SPHN|nr:response regulator transcription factor [Sphingomonas prati]MBB5727951.1 two-component system OmpR family response regulator [Sphingomonas prati]GGE82109.1 DNA-binding response regulator [Sphingomonas prati]